jgi:hypothetical protein
VYLPSKPSNNSKELKTQPISYLGPNAILVASEATSRSFKLATPTNPVQTAPIRPPMDANEQRNAIRFNNPTPQNHPRKIWGKNPFKPKTSKSNSPVGTHKRIQQQSKRLTPAKQICNQQNKRILHQTANTLIFYKRKNDKTNKKRLCSRPSTPTFSTATKQIEINTKSHHQSTRTTSTQTRKHLLQNKNKSKNTIRQRFQFPTCIICQSNAAESPLHLLCECPTTQSIASIACDTVIIQNINELRTNLVRPKRKKKIPIPSLLPFWNNQPDINRLWVAQGAIPTAFDVQNIELGFNQQQCNSLAEQLSLLLIERSQCIYTTRTTLHNKALRERPPEQLLFALLP